jgi:hypothetical protein
MINTNRTLRSVLAAMSGMSVALAVVVLPGCASEKSEPPPQKSSAAVPAAAKVQPASLTQIKTDLLESQSQLQLTTDALNKLGKSNPADAAANYNSFAQEYIKLQAKADKVTGHSTVLKDKAAAYFAQWNRQVTVENPDLRREALQQKADAQQLVNTINNEAELTRLSFRPYMANLKDVGEYLRGNLTPATLTSVSGLVEKANGEAKEVDSHLTAILGAVDKILTSTGEGAAAGAGPAAVATPPAR